MFDFILGGAKINFIGVEELILSRLNVFH